MADKKDTGAAWRYAGGIILLPLCLFTTLSLFSYTSSDISLLCSPPNPTPVNLIGPVGAWMSFLLFMGLGIGAYLIPLWCLIFSMILLFDHEKRIWPKLIWFFIIMLAMLNLIQISSSFWEPSCRRLNIVDAGGIFSYAIANSLVSLFSPVGTGILLWSMMAVAVVLMVEVRNLVTAARWSYRVLAHAVTVAVVYVEERRDRRERIETEVRKVERKRRVLEKEFGFPEGADDGELIRVPRSDPKPPERKTEPETETREKLKEKARELAEHQRETQAQERRKDQEEKIRAREADGTAKKPEPVPTPKPATERRKPAEVPVAVVAAPATQPKAGTEYQLPPIALLDPLPETGTRGIKADHDTTGKIIVETLDDFGIQCEVVNFEEGPAVTRFELLPAPGVKVERITGLSGNLALSLKATSVRVQAPIPGKGVVGIEVPNEIATKVYLREIIEGDLWQSRKQRVPLLLGKDVGGKDIVADLTTMPHLLIAGSTGSGKTVCMNTILCGLLMSMKPSELRLLLVDPKIVEFSPYSSIPHLVVPVVTDPKKVSLALRWAVNEMEKRYKLFSTVGVRNIESFNQRPKVRQGDLFGAPDTRGTPDTVPYIVIVIDELADLMLADKVGVENGIARLAQLSRAVGIHMIIATQRPSVNVVTGTIKANFPARISFQVAQKNDSRIILDAMGAEKLLGRGDMLFLPPGTSKLVRAQGALSKDEDIARVVDYIKKQAQPTYDQEIHEKLEKTTVSSRSGEAGNEDDELTDASIQIIKETRRASTSSLQRRLRIGYTRAARIMDILEERGVVGPPRGSDAREILIDLEGEIPRNTNAPEGYEETPVSPGE